MKTYGGVDVLVHIFLTSALVGGDCSASRLSSFNTEERGPGTHWIGGWVGPRTGLDDVERTKILPLPGLELRARNKSLYQLRCRGFWLVEGNMMRDVQYVYEAQSKC
jgi:hypothetical protein